MWAISVDWSMPPSDSVESTITDRSSTDSASISRATASASSVPWRSVGSSTASEIRVVALKNGRIRSV